MKNKNKKDNCLKGMHELSCLFRGHEKNGDYKEIQWCRVCGSLFITTEPNGRECSYIKTPEILNEYLQKKIKIKKVDKIPKV